jgi:hypothetical protein
VCLIGQFERLGSLELHPAPWTPSARVPGRTACLVRPGSKGLKGIAGPISKNQTKGKGVGRPSRGAHSRLRLAPGPLLGVACPRLQVPSPPCGPTSPIWDTRYDPARYRWKRAHGAHGRLVRARIGSKWDAVDRRRGSNFKNQRKGKGAAGFELRSAPRWLLTPEIPLLFF